MEICNPCFVFETKLFHILEVKSFIDRLRFFIYICFLDATRIGYTFPLLIFHEFELFWSLHMCAPRKCIGCSGTRTRYPRARSQPR